MKELVLKERASKDKELADMKIDKELALLNKQHTEEKLAAQSVELGQSRAQVALLERMCATMDSERAAVAASLRAAQVRMELPPSYSYAYTTLRDSPDTRCITLGVEAFFSVFPLPTAPELPQQLAAAKDSFLQTFCDSLGERTGEAAIQGALDAALVAGYAQLTGGASPWTFKIRGTSSEALLGSRKPDFAGFPEPLPAVLHVSSIVVLGELKPSSGSKFTDEHLGQLVSGLQLLWRLQADQRALAAGGGMAVGFVCNKTHICFVRLDFMGPDSGALSATVSTPVEWDAGGAALLFQLCTVPSATLGYRPLTLQLPDVSLPVAVTHVLGRGATSLGAALQHGGAEVVAKVFTGANALTLADTERGILAAVRSAIPVDDATLPGIRIVRLADDQIWRDQDERPALLLTPRGVACYAMPVTGRLMPLGYSPPTAAEFEDLLRALQRLHAAGWVHRDPRPENFFRDEDGGFVLSDLGSATLTGAVYKVGSGRAQSNRYGPAMCWERPYAYAHTAGHDLEQVARLVFAASHQLAIPLTGNPNTLKRAWGVYAHCAGLERLLGAAEAAGHALAGDNAAAEAGTQQALAAFTAVIREELPPPLPAEDGRLAPVLEGGLGEEDELADGDTAMG